MQCIYEVATLSSDTCFNFIVLFKNLINSLLWKFDEINFSHEHVMASRRMLVWCANRHFQAHTLYIKIYIYVSHESEMMWHFSLFKEMRNKKWKTKQQQEQQEETLVFLFSKCIEFWRWFHFCLPFTFSIIVILFIHLPVNGFYTQQITALLCSNIQRMQKEKFERSFAVFHSIHWRVQFSKTKLYCLYSMAKCLCYPLRAWKTIVCCSHGSVQFSGNWTDGESKRERETEKRLGKSIFAHIRSPSHPLLDLSVGKWFFVVCMKDTYDHTNKGERQVEFNVFVFVFLFPHSLRSIFGHRLMILQKLIHCFSAMESMYVFIDFSYIHIYIYYLYLFKNLLNSYCTYSSHK